MEYWKTEKGLAAAKRYRDSTKGKEAAARYREKIKELKNYHAQIEKKNFEVGKTVIHKENKSQWIITLIKKDVATIVDSDENAKAVKISTLQRYYEAK